MKSTFKLVLFFAAAIFILSNCNPKKPDDPCFLETTLDISPAAGDYIITALPTKGTEPYTYKWSTGSSSDKILVHSLDSIYSVTVTDYIACTATASTPHSSDATCDTTIEDYDGNIYHVVRIGEHCWTVENLRTTHYFNGLPITEVEDSVTWTNNFSQSGTTPEWCYYHGDAGNNAIYGKLYNWYAIGGASGSVAPAGWHVATEADYTQLINYLGGHVIAGGKMKTTGLWASPNTGADNSSQFTAVPAGFRFEHALYSSLGYQALFWSGTEKSAGAARYYDLYYNEDSVFADVCNKHLGFSVRLVHDY
jgi:uncharacterized protein (TIGR02145 family)